MTAEQRKPNVSNGGRDEREASKMAERLIEQGAPRGRAEELVRDAIERNKAGKP